MTEGGRHRARLFIAGGYIAVAGAALGCAAPVETHSAYADQAYLCTDDAADALATAVASCTAAWQRDRSCGGIMSFSGQIEGNAVTVTSELDGTSFRVALPSDDETAYLDRIDSNGAGPYFRFSFKAKSLGGDAEATTATARTLTLNRTATTQPGHLTDGVAELALRLTAGGDSADLLSLDDGGVLVLDEQAPERLVGHFDARFGEATNAIQGCFTLLAIEVRQFNE